MNDVKKATFGPSTGRGEPVAGSLGNPPQIVPRPLRGPKTAYLRPVRNICQRCRKTCKQSKWAKVISCPQFEAKNEKTDNK